MNQVVITIARQYGSGGRTVGKMLAERLGISFYDKQIIQMASDESGIDVKLFGKVEEGDKVKGSLFGNKECIYKGNLHQPGSKEFIGKLISSQLEAVINDREAKCLSARDRGKVPVVDEQPAPSTSQVIQPIIAAGDAIGSVILMGRTDKDIPSTSEKLLAQTAAGFLGRQMEQ